MKLARSIGLLTLLALPASAGGPVLPFVEDDYAKALSQAVERHVPIFVDAWAPWCHTCRSMQAFVFTDASLAPRARQFVWLSINTEKKSNAAFLTKYPVEAWPTLFVVDPNTETALVRFAGGATVTELGKLLDDGRRAAEGQEKGVDEILAKADLLYGEKKHVEAAAAYRKALAKAPADWPSYPRAVQSLLFASRRAGDRKGCAEAARDAFPRLRNLPSAADVTASGLDCALSLKPDDPGRPALVGALAADAREVIGRRSADVAADDISSLYGSLADEREAAGDEAGRHQILVDWASFLEAEAARAATPEARTVFDSHRLEVYLALGQAERAIPMLKQSEKDFPDDYNPPARLALAYEGMKEYERALMASDSALHRAYGPRMIQILTARSRICLEKGDRLSARIAMEEAIRNAEALPPGQRSDAQIASLQKRLEELPQ